MSDVFQTDKVFADLGLRDSVLKGAQEAGFEHPTDIQARLIPMILEGKDALGQAKTGTGKTAAFGLPLMHLADPEVGGQALILAPTRELANQIVVELNELAQFTPIKAASVVGGESYKKQMKDLESGAHLIVGTPGRVADLQSRGKLSFDKLRWVVLDEVDRMLDIGFREDIRKLLSRIKGEHQTIFVSATISEDIERLARRFMKEDAEKIETAAKSLTVSLVTQHYVPVKPWDKQRMLLHLLQHEEPGLTVVFCRTKRKVSSVTKYLSKHKIEAFEIHGDLPQHKRNRIMERLREGRLEVLVASDLASRGLDVDDITHVINYDLPDDPEVYVHRIGRTARAGRSGVAWTFVEPEQGQLLTEVEKLTNVHIQKLEYPDFEESEKPANWRDDSGRRPEPELPKTEPRRSRFEEGVGVPSGADGVDPNLFPGGVVPKGPPRKTLGSRFRTRRG